MIHRLDLLAGAVQQIGQVVVQGRLAMQVADPGAERQRILQIAAGPRIVAAVMGRQRQIVQRRHLSRQVIQPPRRCQTVLQMLARCRQVAFAAGQHAQYIGCTGQRAVIGRSFCQPQCFLRQHMGALAVALAVRAQAPVRV